MEPITDSDEQLAQAQAQNVQQQQQQTPMEETTSLAVINVESPNAFLSTIFPDDNNYQAADVTRDHSSVAATSAAADQDKKPKFNAIFNLNDYELNKLDENLKQKLIENGENFIQQYDNLRINYEKFKIEYEQRFIDLEAEYNQCQTKLAAELESSYFHRTKANENGGCFI
jgi:hypothetical protein